MKEMYIRVTANTRIGYDIIRVKVNKEYKEYEIAIVKYNGRYSLTDIKTGLNCGKWFNKLKDAKSFMENIKDSKFLIWYNAVEQSRMTERYKSMIMGYDNMIKCICNDCVHCRNYNGVKRCIKRSFMINPKFIRAWGCDDYKCKYESLLKGQ